MCKKFSRSKPVGILLLVLFVSILLAGIMVVSARPENSSQQGVAMKPLFIHTVFFWLKPGVSEQARSQLIRDCERLLGSIESVRYLAAGVPAGTPREVVDNSFGVGLVVHFDDKAGHDAYQEAEKHQEFIRRNQAIWERVQVYDIQTE